MLVLKFSSPMWSLPSSRCFRVTTNISGARQPTFLNNSHHMVGHFPVRILPPADCHHRESAPGNPRVRYDFWTCQHAQGWQLWREEHSGWCFPWILTTWWVTSNSKFIPTIVDCHLEKVRTSILESDTTHRLLEMLKSKDTGASTVAVLKALEEHGTSLFSSVLLIADCSCSWRYSPGCDCQITRRIYCGPFQLGPASGAAAGYL